MRLLQLSRSDLCRFGVGILVVATLFRIFIAADMPIVIRSYLDVDDALFMRLGQSISASQWLGAFDSGALVKGPGFSIFLALSHWSGLPFSLVLGGFQVSAVAMLGFASRRLFSRPFFAAALFLIVLFYPRGYSAEVLFVNRGMTYWGLMLYALAFLILAATEADKPDTAAGWRAPVDRREVWFLLGGLSFGAMSITREETIFFLPSICLLAGWTIWTLNRSIGRKFRAGLMFVIAASFPAAAVSTANYAAYGVFRVVDWNDPQMERVFKALHSIDSETRRRLLSVPQDVRLKAYETSPAFAELRPVIDPPAPAIGEYSYTGCTHYPDVPELCHDVVNGWFRWAVRGAMQKAGKFSSYRDANSFLKAAADELEEACASGRLACNSSQGFGFAGLPPLSPPDWGLVFKASFHWAISPWRSSASYSPHYHSVNDELEILDFAQFLNWPKISKAEGDGPAVSVHGWILVPGEKFPRVSARRVADGPEEWIKIKRFPWDGDPTSFNAPEATYQGFNITFPCERTCELRFDFGSESMTAIFRDGIPTFDSAKGGSFPIHFRNVSRATYAFGSPPGPAVTAWISAIDPFYRRSGLAGAFLGGLGLVWSLGLAVRDRKISFRVVLLMACLGGALSLTIMLGIINATSYPGFVSAYTLPIEYLLLIAGAFSLLFYIDRRLDRASSGRQRPRAIGGELCAPQRLL